ncbi:MAG: hypothetical protein WCB70_15475, partial [Xanthobacteraceae bacterium]
MATRMTARMADPAWFAAFIIGGANAALIGRVVPPYLAPQGKRSAKRIVKFEPSSGGASEASLEG